MQINVSTYIPGTTPIHTCDARVKLVLLLAYSITLFFVHTWAGLGICGALFALAVVVARLPFGRLLKLLVPVYFILAFTLLFNSFAFDATSVGQSYGLGSVSAGFLEGAEPTLLFGTFCFVPAGLARGCFYSLRIILLVLASLVVTYTTTSNALIDALQSFLRPLRAFHVPTDDIATMFSIALRFIPVTAEEFTRIHAAQWARGSAFDGGSLWRRLRAWQTVLIPLFVGLFRRADNLAIAMESRCYGAEPVRTHLHPRVFSLCSAAALVGGVAACTVIAVAL
ncbi:MAG: energy-coupling factor transporter transmembrane component T [Raoultibacter sp.]